MHLILWQVAKTVGTILLSMLMSLLTGKTFKTLLLAPLKWWASRTHSEFDDKLIQAAEQDLGLDKKEQ